MSNAILIAAKEATKAGLCVVPVPANGRKFPVAPHLKDDNGIKDDRAQPGERTTSWGDFKLRRPTPDELRSWFHEQEQEGLGLVCGAVSGGLELLEFDDPDAIVEFKTAAKAAGLWPIIYMLETGYVERTPGGGIHWLYRVETPLGNTKLASRPCTGCDKHKAGEAHVLIETRGEGGFVVVAPSHGGVHPTGKPYELVAGGFSTIPNLTVEQRDNIWTLARAFDDMPRRVPIPERASTHEGERPGDEFIRQTTWREVLERNDWRFVYERGGEMFWRRPGKREGISATTNYRGSDLFYCFSSSVPEFEPEEGYNRFRVWTLLEHGGNFTASTKAAAALYGMEAVPIDPEELIKKDPIDDALEEIAEANPDFFNPQQSSVSKYRDPNYAFKTLFPPDHFVSRYIEYASSQTDAPHEYHETLGLILLAACTPGVRARLDPWPDGLATNLYVVLVGSSSRTRKSTATRIAKRLLRAVEKLDGRAVFPDRFSPEAMLEQLSMRAGEPSVWFPDEWGKVVEDLPRSPTLENALLTLYDSPPIFDYARHSKRVKGGGSEKDHDTVQDPHWLIVGATTESVFDNLSSSALESGFLPRHAFVYPETLPPRRRLQDSAPERIELQRELCKYLSQLYGWAAACRDAAPYGDPPIDVFFLPEALEILDAYQAEIEESDEGATVRMQGMAIKVAMLSALGVGDWLDAAGNAITKSVTIDIEDAEIGVAMARRWSESALRFARSLGGFDPKERRHQQRCSRALAYVRQQGTCKRQDVMRHMRVSSEDLDRIQRDLVEAGVIVLAKEESTGGRPPLFWRYVK